MYITHRMRSHKIPTLFTYYWLKVYVQFYWNNVTAAWHHGQKVKNFTEGHINKAQFSKFGYCKIIHTFEVRSE